MDPADSLAGFICAFGAGVFGCLAWIGEDVFMAGLAVTFAGALYGFAYEAFAGMREQWGEDAEGG